MFEGTLVRVDQRFFSPLFFEVRVLKFHNPCKCKKDNGWDAWKKKEKKEEKMQSEKCSKVPTERKESSDCLLKVRGSNGFQMCTTSFVFSKEHKTFLLRGI